MKAFLHVFRHIWDKGAQLLVARGSLYELLALIVAVAEQRESGPGGGRLGNVVQHADGLVKAVVFDLHVVYVSFCIFVLLLLGKQNAYQSVYGFGVFPIAGNAIVRKHNVCELCNCFMV